MSIINLRKDQLYTEYHYHQVTIRWTFVQRINSNTVYVPIPKNAHSWMKNSFILLDPVPITEQDRYLIIIRDPIQRWITGMATYCRTLDLYVKEFLADQTPCFDAMLKQTLIPDGHCVPQHYYIKNVDPKICDVFIVNENLGHNINNYLKTSVSLLGVNVSNTAYQQYLIHHLQQYVNTKPELLQQLKELYSGDYVWLQRSSAS